MSRVGRRPRGGGVVVVVVVAGEVLRYLMDLRDDFLGSGASSGGEMWVWDIDTRVLVDSR